MTSTSTRLNGRGGTSSTTAGQNRLVTIPLNAAPVGGALQPLANAPGVSVPPGFAVSLGYGFNPPEPYVVAGWC